MKGRQASVRRLAFAVQLGAILLGTLALPQCSAPEATDTDESHLGSVTSALEHCGGVACSGSGDCATSAPLCANPASATCLLTTPRECAWSLAISASCLCLEHDIRLCTLSGGTPGVQVCTSNKTHTGTYWAACQACPSCSP